MTPNSSREAEMTQLHTLTLRVAEAPSRDVGRAVARLDPEDMARLAAEVGDIVQVLGKRPALARAMPAYPQDRGQGLVQIDGILRENAQAGLGEKVQVQKVDCQQAKAVTLSPLGASSLSGREKDGKHLGRLLEGVPVAQGDKVRAVFLGRHLEFAVVEAAPPGAAVIGPLTAVKVVGEAAARREEGGVTYEDIGGLHRETQRIREMIELPLRYPELFQRLGIDAPKGVLLYGPPGCGKTLIARAVASETAARFFHVSGPEVIHKFYGESEAHLRAIFDKARESAPAIIFLDEIDAIAAKREEVRGDQQVERRVVAQLLALMDGLKDRGQVIVIGATNIPNVLDPALRRPGRFDREIALSIPDKRGRLEIFQIHTRGMPLASDVRLEMLAETSHGFVGADIEALCREAAMASLRRALPRLELGDGPIPDELLQELEVRAGDFSEAFKEVEPSAIREVFTEVPDVAWEDVGGLEEAKRALQETIEWPLKYPDLFQKAGTGPARGILLTGPPGTGKTLLVKAVASQSQANFISVKGPALLSKWVGESEKGIREVFRKAKQASPCIIFFDEIDALAPARGSGADSHVAERVVSQFLSELDGIEELKGVVVLAATNRPDILDPALLRAGRLEVRIELPLPDEKARLDILKIHTRGKPLARDVNLGDLASATEGWVGADIEALCRRAALLAIREAVERQEAGATGADPLEVSAQHFQEALKALKR